MLVITDLFLLQQLSPNHVSILLYSAFHHFLSPLTISLALKQNIALIVVNLYSSRLCNIM